MNSSVTGKLTSKQRNNKTDYILHQVGNRINESIETKWECIAFNTQTIFLSI